MDVKPHYDILIPGNYFCDIIFTGLARFPALGHEIYANNVAIVPGGAMNTVVALRRLGVNVGWVGTVGSDFFSRFALEQAQAEGVDISLLRHTNDLHRHVTVALSYPTDRAFVAHVDELPNVVEMALESLERASCAHLHFTGLEIDERVPALIETCHTRGISVSMDCQHRDETLATPLVREILSRLDVFMPNALEAQRITDTDTLDDAIAVLSEIVPYLVVKRGPDGATACRNGEQCHEPGLVVDAIDTTGAGDIFNAGFLAAHLRGYDMRQCLRWGNTCGAMSAQALGGTANSPTFEHLQKWLDEQ